MLWYWVIQKKLFSWRFQHNQDYIGWNNFCNRRHWQSTISMQVLNIFSDGQNCQNQTFKWLYQLNESKYEKSFFGKILTVMLFHMYQVSSSLLGHLHFSLHFFSTFMEQLFFNHPISSSISNACTIISRPSSWNYSAMLGEEQLIRTKNSNNTNSRSMNNVNMNVHQNNQR